MTERKSLQGWVTRRTMIFFVGELFRVSLLGYLVVLLLEYMVPLFVSLFFNSSILLGVVLASGICTSLYPEDRSEHTKVKKRVRVRDIVFIVLLAVTGALLIYTKTKPIGTIAIAIAALSGVIIALLSLLLLIDDDKEREGDAP